MFKAALIDMLYSEVPDDYVQYETCDQTIENRGTGCLHPACFGADALKTSSVFPRRDRFVWANVNTAKRVGEQVDRDRQERVVFDLHPSGPRCR